MVLISDSSSFLLSCTLADNPVGKVYLVGAGPGDPKLLTLRAAEVLAAANVVLYDGLANLDLEDYIKTKLFQGKIESESVFTGQLKSEPMALATGSPRDSSHIKMLNSEPDSESDSESDRRVLPEASAYGSQLESEWISVGKHGAQRIWKQSEINDAIVHHAKLGKVVVRLKGGDTGIFARTGEELERLVNESIPFEVIPGITAASAVAAYAGIPITHRDWASAVALVTGHSQPSDGGPEADESLDWGSIAKFPGTIVIYMGVTTVGDWSSQLIAQGKTPETPVALVRRCSWPDQETVLCTLRDVAARMTPASKFRPPVLVVIGPVAHLGKPFDWFSRRPLFGKHILVCRPNDRSDTTVDQLESLGATVSAAPALSIEPPQNWEDLDRVIARISQYKWIVFSSRHGVRSLMDRIYTLKKDSRVLGNCLLSGVGASIGEELKIYKLSADYIAPRPFGAKSFIEGFAARLKASPNDFQNKKASILIVGNNRTDSYLSDQLSAMEFHGKNDGERYDVESVCAYQSIAILSPAPQIVDKMRHGIIDYCIATSPAIAQTLIQWFGDELQKTRIASISGAVTQIFRSSGITNICEATEPSLAGILSAILADVSLSLDKTAKES